MPLLECRDENEAYDMCGSPCQRQCGEPEPMCMDMCQEGCFCQAGYIRDDNGRCISEEECAAYLEYTVCQMQLYQSLHLSSLGKTGVFIPTCDENGDFSPVQCYGSIGYCWCARPDGTEIDGTRIQTRDGTRPPICTTRMLQSHYE